MYERPFLEQIVGGEGEGGCKKFYLKKLPSHSKILITNLKTITLVPD